MKASPPKKYNNLTLRYCAISFLGLKIRLDDSDFLFLMIA